MYEGGTFTPAEDYRDQVEPTRPEARAAKGRLDETTERLMKVVNSLEERLHDLLGPERPHEEARLQGIDARLTEFGGQLHAVADEYERLCVRLECLLDRVRDGL